MLNLTNNKIINNSEVFQTDALSNFVKLDDNYVFASYDENKLYKLSEDGKILTPFNTEIDNLLKKYDIYKLSKIDKYLIVLTYTGGIFILDETGKLVINYNRNNAKFDHTAYFAEADKQNNILISDIKGITTIYTSLPITDMSFLVKDIGQINSVKLDKNFILLATTQGTFLIKNYKIKKLLNAESWDIKKHKNEFIIATNDGVFSTDGNSVKLLHPIVNSFQIKVEKDYIYVFSTSGIAKIKDGKIINTFSVKSHLATDIWELDETKAVISTKTGGLLLWNSKDDKLIRKLFEEELNSFTDFIDFNNQKIVYSKNKVFIISKDLKLKPFPKQLPDYIVLNKTIKDEKNNYWLLTADYPLVYNNKAEKISYHLAYLFKRIRTVSVSEDNKTLISDGNNLILLNKSQLPEVSKKIKLILNYIMHKGDTIYFYESSDYYSLAEKIPYEYNEITISFGIPNYIGENLYRYSINDHWSDFIKEQRISVGPLREDLYKIQILATNPLFDKEITTTVEFAIAPPWYRTTLAYISYIFLLIAIIYGSFRAYLYKIERDRKRLQELVDQQTHELKQVNEELNQINEELKTVNEELKEKHAKLEEAHTSIMESINYAKRIQDAILPDISPLKTIFSDVAYIYLPRDRVGGDFYWFYENNGNKYFAVVDCTGHGVPGAMMSTLGASALNRILLNNPDISPAKILELLNKDVYNTLHKKGGKQNDGMDLIICKFSKDIITFAGAKRPLWLLQDSQIIELETDKISIGEKPDAKFNNYTLEWNQVEHLYLFSDGLQDQLGGPKDRKLGKKRIKEIILNNKNKPANQIAEEIFKFLSKWKKGTHQELQTDDITFFILIK